MKIVCIKRYWDDLTLGKIYESIDFTETWVRLGYQDKYYQLINNKNYISYYDKSCFVTLEEWRETKINELGIE